MKHSVVFISPLDAKKLRIMHDEFNFIVVEECVWVPKANDSRYNYYHTTINFETQLKDSNCKLRTLKTSKYTQIACSQAWHWPSRACPLLESPRRPCHPDISDWRSGDIFWREIWWDTETASMNNSRFQHPSDEIWSIKFVYHSEIRLFNFQNVSKRSRRAGFHEGRRIHLLQSCGRRWKGQRRSFWAHEKWIYSVLRKRERASSGGKEDICPIRLFPRLPSHLKRSYFRWPFWKSNSGHTFLAQSMIG